MGVVEELQQAAGRITAEAGPAVVRIGRDGGRGAGVVLREGVVVTNAHNLRGPQTTITFADGRVATGTVAGADVDGDLAVITVDTTGVTPLRWGPETADAPVGTPVWALASVAGRGLRVTLGTVSAVGQEFSGPRGRRIAGSIEHTAPLMRGSSGGPVVDNEGRLLGINTHRLGGGFYLAVPADSELEARVDALARGESPTRIRLGVAVAPAEAARKLRAAVGLPPRDGVLIRGVEDGGPASRAGVLKGDLIVAAGGRAITTADELFEVLDGLHEGDSLSLRIVRGAEELDVSVGFGASDATAEGTA
jgi:serine protease Do